MRYRLVSGLVLGCAWLITAMPSVRDANIAHVQAMPLIRLSKADSIWRTAEATNAKQVEAGETVYQQHCAVCHGVDLEGQPNWKQLLPTGGLPAPPHDDTGHTWHHPDQLLFRITKFGGQAVAGPGFQSNMPAFQGVLSDADIWAVLAFIKSKWSPRASAFQERANARKR